MMGVDGIGSVGGAVIWLRHETQSCVFNFLQFECCNDVLSCKFGAIEYIAGIVIVALKFLVENIVAWIR